MSNLNQFRSSLLLTLCLGLAACSSSTEQSGTVASVAELPAGWSVRADSGSGVENKMMVEDRGFHFMMGGPPANNGTLYNPEWTATGDHTFSATLTQNIAATHPTSYGLMFGGSNLDNDGQMYSYFLVRQAGEYYIATRNGTNVTAVVPWTADPAVMPEGADGKQTNTLAVQVEGDRVIFSINGKEVKRLPVAGLHVNGMYGFRIGHRLDVTVSDVSK